MAHVGDVRLGGVEQHPGRGADVGQLHAGIGAAEGNATAAMDEGGRGQ